MTGSGCISVGGGTGRVCIGGGNVTLEPECTSLGCVEVQACGGCVASWARSVCACSGVCGSSVEGGMDASAG